MNGHGKVPGGGGGGAADGAPLRLKVVSSFKAHANDVTSVQWTGNVMASGSADKTIRVWKTGGRSAGQVELHEMSYSPMREHYYHVQCLHFSSFGNTLATCATDGKVVLWDTLTGSQITAANFPLPALMALRCCRISSDSRLVAAGGDGDAVALWSFDRTQGLTLLKVFHGHEATITCVCFSHDGAFLLSGSSGADIRVWDCRGLQDHALCVWRDAHDLGCTCMDMAAYRVSISNGDAAFHVATGGYDNTIKLWHLIAGKSAGDRSSSSAKFLPGGAPLLGHSADICSVRFANQTKLLISCSSDRTFIVWDPIRSCALKRVGPLTKYARSCCFSSDDQYVMAGFSGGLVGFWKILTDGEEDSAVQSITVGRDSTMMNAGRAVPFQFLDDTNAPEEFLCPITQEIMREPVVAEDGKSYEKAAISLWFQKHDTSPHTNLPVRSKVVLLNLNLKALISKWSLLQERTASEA
ncbi:putative WD repeat, SAM and U-box domain-containing protein 1 [Hypsibius exemplaris]|uniref:WD repeat, SAM and U-box domain-containing protein 1 n=1 Tax=Hypsibius exemplaris TaxID=2072580 RepID=A0A1W0X9X7_HYPEX|nr:putative WD repeat, SAM and U-box domain-containing protein 1 [Hypsibius exemplaris]